MAGPNSTFFLVLLLAAATRLPAQPLSFEPNQGQADAHVRYLSRAHGYTMTVSGSEVILAGRGSPPLRMMLVNANPRARIEGLERLPGISNYFPGNDPAKWRTRIPHYRRVALREVYPGIDLVFYGDRGEMEYDWVVAPGADPRKIRLRMEGAGDLRIEPNGDLLLNAAIRQRKPVVYQQGGYRRAGIDGGYVVRGAEVAFRVAAYDKRAPLVIDPTLVYTTFLGGRGQSNIATGVAVDAAGNAYLTGYTDSPDFPTLKPFQAGFQGAPTMGVVTKMSPAGTLLYSTFLGSLGNNQAQGIAVDGAGNAYVAGIAGSLDFPTVNPIQPTGGAFVSKIAPDGAKLVYSTLLGGSSGDQCYGIALDPEGNAYITGNTRSKDFPIVNAAQASFSGFIDVFVSKINAAGNALVYSTYLGGNLSSYGKAIAVDPDGNAYIGGYTNSMDFPTLNALLGKYPGGQFTGFVTKLGGDGSLLYSTFLGGKSVAIAGDRVLGIAADIAGNAYAEGSTASPDFPIPPGGPAGSTVARTFVTKLASDGTLGYTTYVPETTPGSDSDRFSSVAVDLAGNAYVTGMAYSANFSVTSDALQSTIGAGTPNIGIGDAFLTRFHPDGTKAYATYLGGSDLDVGRAIAVRGSDAYIAGYTASSDFPTTNPNQARSRYGDIFVTRIGGDAPLPAVILNGASLQPGPIAPGEWITVQGDGIGPPDGASYTVNDQGSVDATLVGVQVLFDNIPGTPTYVSSNAINVIVPYEIGDRASSNVSVIYQQAVSLPIVQPVQAFSPAIYKVINADGTANGAGAPASQNSVISVYATGGGQTDPPSATGSVNPQSPPLPLANAASVTATIGGKPAAVIFAGATAGDLTGMLRIDVRTAMGVTGDALPISISIGGVASPGGPTVAIN